MGEGAQAEWRVALTFGAGLGNSKRDAFSLWERKCCMGAFGGRGGGTDFVLDKLSYEVSQGHRDMKILKGWFKLWLWSSGEKNGI